MKNREKSRIFTKKSRKSDAKKSQMHTENASKTYKQEKSRKVMKNHEQIAKNREKCMNFHEKRMNFHSKSIIFQQKFCLSSLLKNLPLTRPPSRGPANTLAQHPRNCSFSKFTWTPLGRLLDATWTAPGFGPVHIESAEPTPLTRRREAALLYSCFTKNTHF